MDKQYRENQENMHLKMVADSGAMVLQNNTIFHGAGWLFLTFSHMWNEQ